MSFISFYNTLLQEGKDKLNSLREGKKKLNSLREEKDKLITYGSRHKNILLSIQSCSVSSILISHAHCTVTKILKHINPKKYGVIEQFFTISKTRKRYIILLLPSIRHTSRIMVE